MDMSSQSAYPILESIDLPQDLRRLPDSNRKQDQN